MISELSARRIISYAVLASLIVATLVLIYSGLIGEPVVAVVKGNSMLPLLREGDIVIIMNVKPSEINTGDVIVFKTFTGTLVIHRVIGITVEDNKYYYVTKGDNNPFPDFTHFVDGKGVPYERVVGKVMGFNNAVFKIPYLGNLALMARKEN
ncbi:MAG: signal peptidase I [Desulfurococcaceae archaeon]